MTICFLCGSLEEGRDGVGDYTRLLAGKLSERGFDVSIVALYDRYVQGPDFSEFRLKGKKIRVLRFPPDFKERFETLRKWLQTYPADLLSLQFVPYGYNNKGLPFMLAAKLKTLQKGTEWHVMFHELWVGTKDEIPIKQKIIRFLQKQIIHRLIQMLSPKLITTSIPLYQAALRKYPVKILPLFSNIPIEVNFVSKKTLPQALFNVIHFGSVTSFLFSFEEQLNWIQKHAQYIKRKPSLTFTGSGGPYQKEAIAIAERIFGVDSVSNRGLLSSPDISAILLQSDIGLSRADSDYYGKSGSTLAILEAGLPVLLRGARPDKKVIEEDTFRRQILFSSDPAEQYLVKQSPHSGLSNTASLFIEYLAPSIAES